MVLVSQVFPIGTAYAAGQIADRSLELRTGSGGDYGSNPSGVVNHLFSFTIPTAGDVGSIKFEYCTLAAGVCTMPTDLDTQVVAPATALGDQTGAIGFTLVGTSQGAPYLTRTVANVAALTPVTYRLDNVGNPSTTGTFFVRISTYVSEDATGTAIDAGVVAASTAWPVPLRGIMPESLVFCTGATISITPLLTGVPDCATATTGTIDFNQLFSPTDTATATSQMAASTNAESGYVIGVWGETMTSGSNEITEMSARGLGVRGTKQFGMNLLANTLLTSTPLVGVGVTPANDAVNFNGQPMTGYGTQDEFKFTSGDSVANSNSLGTDAQIFTVSYIVNVTGNLPAGTYTTTLTYICTPEF